MGKDGSKFYAMIHRTRWGDVATFFTMTGCDIRFPGDKRTDEHVLILVSEALKLGRFVRLVPEAGF